MVLANAAESKLLAKIRKVQFTAHAFGVQITIGASRFPPESAPAGVPPPTFRAHDVELGPMLSNLATAASRWGFRCNFKNWRPKKGG